MASIRISTSLRASITASNFDYSRNWSQIDCRAHPEEYQTGRPGSEQGVLLVEPYKSELLPLWRFRTPEVALESSEAILRLYEAYKGSKDYVGMDMTRKFLQMGYTRAMRYCSHKGGKKYDGLVPADKKGQSGSHGRLELPKSFDQTKYDAAQVFKRAWTQVLEDSAYQEALTILRG